jgi:hypothetical protein
MPGHQVFICHSSLNADVGREVVDYLEARGIRCWISFRDVAPGENFQEAIVRAIRDAPILLLLFSEASNRSNEIKKELALAGSFNLSVLPLRLSAIKPNEALLYELSTRQWIDGWPDRQVAFARLLTSIEEVLARVATGDPDSDQSTRIVVRPRVPPPQPDPPAPPRPPQASTIGPPSPPALGADDRARLRTLLVKHVGPIGRMLVDRAVAEQRGADAICAQLASHLPPNVDRAAFIRAARQIFPR